jgi:hypothetical protein
MVVQAVQHAAKRLSVVLVLLSARSDSKGAQTAAQHHTCTGHTQLCNANTLRLQRGRTVLPKPANAAKLERTAANILITFCSLRCWSYMGVLLQTGTSAVAEANGCHDSSHSCTQQEHCRLQNSVGIGSTICSSLKSIHSYKLPSSQPAHK